MGSCCLPECTTSFKLVAEKQLNDEVFLMEWCDTMDLLAVVSKRKETANCDELSVYRLSLQRVFSISVQGNIYSMAWRPDGAEIVLGGRGLLVSNEEGGDIHDERKTSRHDVLNNDCLDLVNREQPILWIIDVENGDILRTCPIRGNIESVMRLNWLEESEFLKRTCLPEDAVFGSFLSNFPGNYVTSDDVIYTMPNSKRLLKECNQCISEFGKGM